MGSRWTRGSDNADLWDMIWVEADRLKKMGAHIQIKWVNSHPKKVEDFRPEIPYHAYRVNFVADLLAADGAALHENNHHQKKDYEAKQAETKAIMERLLAIAKSLKLNERKKEKSRGSKPPLSHKRWRRPCLSPPMSSSRWETKGCNAQDAWHSDQEEATAK